MSYVSSLGNLEKNSGMPDSENENKRLMDRPAKRYSSQDTEGPAKRYSSQDTEGSAKRYSSQDTEGFEGYEEGHVYSSPYAHHPPYVQHPDEIKDAMTVTSQPGSAAGSTKEIEEYLVQLAPSEIAKWTTDEVCTQFLERIEFAYLIENFKVNNITGRVLLMLEERNLVEMGVNVIGDRLMILSYLKLLKKKKIEADKMATLWQGETPAPGLAYSEDCCQCMSKMCCPCCITRKLWRITGQGIFYRIVPPCSMFTEVRQEYIDFRFLKDMELRTRNTFACCCRTHELIMYAEQASDEDTPDSRSIHPVLHPDAEKVETIVRTAWSNARLVAD
ncbi:uncharacterized protein LOC134822593 isoform X2 [Bolinopsis microptera]|uniref:uncharacterized protein LOC134822593 isoform X2 n=1 Tax=Bolinopsis microptera TaxID=2820187 RepID=UPI0030795292